MIKQLGMILIEFKNWRKCTMAKIMTAEEKARAWDEKVAKEKKYWDNQKLLLAKCKKLGIVNTPAEVDEFQADPTKVNVEQYKEFKHPNKK